MSLEETEEEGDTIVEIEGIRFVFDPHVVRHAKGATVDYKKTFFGKGFSISTRYGGDC